MLPDSMPYEKQDQLEIYTFISDLSVLNPDAAAARASKLFFEHFISLKHVDFEMTQAGQPGSYAVLLRLLQPVAATLHSIDLKISLHDGDEESIRYLHYVLPCEDFEGSKRLQRLYIPYQVLFGCGRPSVVSNHCRSSRFAAPNYLGPGDRIPKHRNKRVVRAFWSLSQTASGTEPRHVIVLEYIW
jgi:hypothetical protein